ncbi:MAG: YeeE/YedE thiosulfate transporter family protein [Bacteroidota bacterium]
MELISQFWPWYVAGPLIALVMMLMILLGRRFGISTSLEALCTIGGAGKRFEYFNKDWKANDWLLVFIVGTMIGGTIATYVFPNPDPIQISAATIADLKAMGVELDKNLAPAQVFSWDNLLTVKGLIIMVGGGFLIGFGTRYAGGCTSGHAISGLSNLQIPSLVAVIGFFIGGLFSTFVLLPLIFSL